MTKVKELRAPVESGSLSDIVLHFLYIHKKSNVYEDPTLDELYELNSAKYKKKDNLSRAISRLTKMKLISSYNVSKGLKRYVITDLGIDAIYKLAMHRRRKKVARGIKDED